MNIVFFIMPPMSYYCDALTHFTRFEDGTADFMNTVVNILGKVTKKMPPEYFDIGIKKDTR